MSRSPTEATKPDLNETKQRVREGLIKAEILRKDDEH